MNFQKLTAQFITFLCLILILTGGALAQSEDTGKNEFGVWGGFSPDSSTVFQGVGRTRDARFGIVSFRYARRFNNNNTVNLKYTVDVTPIAVLNDRTLRAVSAGVNAFRVISNRENYYGWGAAPLGLQANFRPRKKIQPFVGGSGGFLYFNKTLQSGFGTRFNFTADVGGGVEFRLNNNRALTVGYKYYHISNAKRGITNPGIDNNLFYVGYSFSK